MEHDGSQSSSASQSHAQSPSTWTPEGKLTIAEAKRFQAEMLARLDKNTPFTVDLSKVERLDSAGTQILIAATRTGMCTITGIPSAIQTKLAQVGFLGLLAR